MEITLSLSLPHDELSVPMVRAICTKAMSSLGVRDGCVEDIEVALTEACTNVLNHAVETDEYGVTVRIDDVFCTIDVVDAGGGFDEIVREPDAGDVPLDATAETGRGIQIMRALVDRVQFTSGHGNGTICRLEKRLEWDEAAPLRLLAKEGQARGVR